MKIVPLFDRVLLRPIVERVSDAGIYIPHAQSERSQIMVVEAAGENVCVKTGEEVVVCKYAGAEVMRGTEKLFIVKECDILAKIEQIKGEES